MERSPSWIWSTIWPISSLSFDNRFPTLGTSHLSVFTHLGLSPHFFLIPVLESRKDNLDIQVKCRDLPSMSSLSPPRVPLIADNMEMPDNLGYPWTFSPDNVDIRCIALRPLSCGSYWNYRCFILIYRASGVRSS